MLKEYKTKTNIGVGLGLVGYYGGAALARVETNTALALLGVLLTLAGAGFFIWGCCSYMKGKGHHPAWGVLGLFGCCGLVVLIFFPDKYK